MSRTKRGNIAKKRRYKILKLAKGFQNSQSKLFSSANQQVMKALKYSYNDRRKKKLHFKKLWIKRINITCQINGTNYNRTVKRLKENKIILNRKIISKILTIDKETTELINKSENKIQI